MSTVMPRSSSRRSVYLTVLESCWGRGIPPTVREVASACRILPSTVHHHLIGLEGSGLLRRAAFRGNPVWVPVSAIPDKGGGSWYESLPDWGVTPSRSQR